MVTAHFEPKEWVGETLGHYRLIELAGMGGMAYVYRGVHTQLEQPVAIKILWPEFARKQEVCQRFIQEARVQFQLRHPGLVRVTDLVEEAGLLGMVMDWIDGCDLAEYLRAQRELLSAATLRRLCLPLLETLAYAHSMRVVHRDIKPANILLEGAPGAESPRLMDFGIAKALDNDGLQTDAGTFIGTPHFLAPEQIHGDVPVDHRADIYALGVTFYQMVTGVLPFRGDGPLQLLHAHCMLEPPKMREMAYDVDPAIEGVIRKALEKEPAHRYESCAAFAEALEQVLPPDAEPIGWPSPSLGTELASCDSLDALLSEPRAGRRWPEAEGLLSTGQWLDSQPQPLLSTPSTPPQWQASAFLLAVIVALLGLIAWILLQPGSS